jgi:hypothetical protein
VIFALLLLAMASGQLADLEGFKRILATYRVLAGAEGFVAVAVPVTEALTGALLLLRHRVPGGAARTAGAAGVAVAVFWSALAAQAFVRGLPIDNCGCFGVHLGQQLRWWVLLQDVYFVALALLAARAAGVRLPLGALGRPAAEPR